jgi:hypothetical protein
MNGTIDTIAPALDGTLDTARLNVEDIFKMKEEMATLAQLVHEQQNRVGPTQRADENRIIQLIKKHSKPQGLDSSRMETQQLTGFSPPSGHLTEEQVMQLVKDCFPDLLQAHFPERTVVNLIKDHFPEEWVRQIFRHMIRAREGDIRQMCREAYGDYDSKTQEEIIALYDEIFDKSKAMTASMEEREGLLLNAKDEIQAEVLSQVLQEMTTLVESKIASKDETQNAIMDTVLQEMNKMVEQRGWNQIVQQAMNQDNTEQNGHKHEQPEVPEDPEPPKEDAQDKWSGYVHMHSREKAIAANPEAQSKLMDNLYLWKMEFESKDEAVKWLNEKELESTPVQKEQHKPPFPTPWSKAKEGQNNSPSSKDEDNIANMDPSRRWETRQSNRDSPERYSAASSAEREFMQRREEELRAQLDHPSPTGYYIDGTPFYEDMRGYRSKCAGMYPKNAVKAGQFVPNQEECYRMAQQFEREDYRDRYRQDHQGQRSPPPSPGDAARFKEMHPGRREEFRNPEMEPHYQTPSVDLKLLEMGMYLL